MPASRPARSTSVGSLEAEVLEALWEQGELSARAVHDLVGEPRGLAYTTVLTVLQRLTQKELTTRRRARRGHAYAPAVSREQFAEMRGATLASTFVDIGDAGVAAFLAEAERLDPAIVQTLRRRLRARR